MQRTILSSAIALISGLAVFTAVHAATGVWMNDLPLTPERGWRALRGARRHE